MKGDNAYLTHLTVEIKVIRIDGRRMTLSVFDQLPKLNIFEVYERAATLTATYRCWGIVKRQDCNWLLIEKSGTLHKCELTDQYIELVRMTDSAESRKQIGKDPREIPPQERNEIQQSDCEILDYIEDLVNHLPQLFIAT